MKKRNTLVRLMPVFVLLLPVYLLQAQQEGAIAASFKKKSLISSEENATVLRRTGAALFATVKGTVTDDAGKPLPA